MLGLRDKFGQKHFQFGTKAWQQKQVFESFREVQTNIAGRVKLFMVFYLCFLSILSIIFNYRRP